MTLEPGSPGFLGCPNKMTVGIPARIAAANAATTTTHAVATLGHSGKVWTRAAPIAILCKPLLRVLGLRPCHALRPPDSDRQSSVVAPRRQEGRCGGASRSALSAADRRYVRDDVCSAGNRPRGAADRRGQAHLR